MLEKNKQIGGRHKGGVNQTTKPKASHVGQSNNVLKTKVKNQAIHQITQGLKPKKKIEPDKQSSAAITDAKQRICEDKQTVLNYTKTLDIHNQYDIQSKVENALISSSLLQINDPDQKVVTRQQYSSAKGKEWYIISYVKN